MTMSMVPTRYVHTAILNHEHVMDKQWAADICNTERMFTTYTTHNAITDNILM